MWGMARIVAYHKQAHEHKHTPNRISGLRHTYLSNPRHKWIAKPFISIFCSVRRRQPRWSSIKYTPIVVISTRSFIHINLVLMPIGNYMRRAPCIIASINLFAFHFTLDCSRNGWWKRKQQNWERRIFLIEMLMMKVPSSFQMIEIPCELGSWKAGIIDYDANFPRSISFINDQKYSKRSLGTHA